MAHALPVYAVAALLLVASAGPVLSGVRNASLGEFEGLSQHRPINDFPFLKAVRPYLPPLIVDWIVVDPARPFDLPPGADFYVDPNGRIIYVFPDGCQETQETFRSGSDCAGPPDCTQPDNATRTECDPCADPAASADPACTPPPECDLGLIPVHSDGAWTCTPDPACSDPEGDGAPDHCPPPPPPPPSCPDDTVTAYDGTCVTLETRLLRSKLFNTPEAQPPWNGPFELKVPYENLSLQIDLDGTFFQPSFIVKLFYTSPTNELVCWWSEGQSGGACTGEPDGGGGIGGQTLRYEDAQPGTIPAGNLTLQVSYDAGPTSPSNNPYLHVKLFGKPHDPRTAPEA